jgi:hypothetical protein
VCRNRLGHRFRPIASRQNTSAIAQHDQPTRILGNAASVDRPGDRQVVVPINDLLLAGAFAALFKQLDGILAFGHGRPLQMVAPATAVYPLFRHNIGIPNGTEQ